MGFNRPEVDFGSQHRLRSLWELMLKQSALEFGRSLADLRLMAMVSGNSVNFNLSADQINGIKTSLQDTLGNLKRIAILSNLDDALGPELERFQAALAIESLSQLSGWADHLRHRVQDELQNEWYFQVDRAEVEFYANVAPFGPEVAVKFKEARSDLTNAGNCISLQQPDACVFHIARGMEVAVRQLGRKLGVTITPQSTWRSITGAMDSKIKGLPETNKRQKDKKNEWESARANLHALGSVWRNKTMHPASTYSRRQARDVFDAARIAMRSLCDL